MELARKKILVTGADGFIGSHLTEELVHSGCNVRAFVFYNSFDSLGWLDTLDPKLLASMEVFAGDIRDPHGIRQAMKGCDIVFHLAALIAIPYSYHSPNTYVETNVMGTLNVVQAVRELGVEKMVHTSTSEVYGTARFVPITEEHPLQGQSPYSASKIGADHITLSFYHSFNTPVVIVRPFNTYGPRQSTRAVIPSIITQIARGERCLRLGTLTPTRDFNYVKDTVAGFIAAAKADNCIGETINIGSNFEISISNTVAMISRLMNAEVYVETEQIRIRPIGSEVERLWASNRKALLMMGWQPAYGDMSGLERGLTETIEWYTNSTNLDRYKRGYTL